MFRPTFRRLNSVPFITRPLGGDVLPWQIALRHVLPWQIALRYLDSGRVVNYKIKSKNRLRRKAAKKHKRHMRLQGNLV